MHAHMSCLVRVAFAVSLWAIPAPGAHAYWLRNNPYFQIAPGMSLGQATYNISALGRAYSHVPPWMFGFNPYTSYAPVSPTPAYWGCLGRCNGPLNSPYYGVAPYYSGVPLYAAPYFTNPYLYGDPYGGYLSGAASIMGTQGQPMQEPQQAPLDQDQFRQDATGSQRRVFDEWRYEQANSAGNNQQRDQALQQAIRRSLNHPPATEIWNGEALNVLLQDIQTMQARGIQGPAVGLDPATLKLINVTTSAGGNAGLLQDGVDLVWPKPLRELEPAGQSRQLRDHLDTLTRQASRQARVGRVDASVRQQMQRDLDALDELLQARTKVLAPSDYLEARRYLNDLGATLKLLGQPHAAGQFEGTYKARGRTVPELIDFMTTRKLKFAPSVYAVAGQDAAYLALHSALVQYDLACRSQAPPR